MDSTKNKWFLRGSIKKNIQMYCIISALYDDKKYGNVVIADIVLQGNEIPSRKDQIALVERIIKTKFVDNINVSSRQIPAWFRFRKSIPLTVNSKVNYNALAKEPLQGYEVKVYIEETNISVNKIVVC